MEMRDRANHGTLIQGANTEKRIFIPMVSVYTNRELMKAILPHTSWIGFNYFELVNSKYYKLAQAKGVSETFGIDDKTKIFLTSTAKDEQLIHFYEELNGLEKFKSDIRSFDVNLAMGPDWFSYKDDPPEVRKETIAKAIELTTGCLEIENIVPAIRGTNFEEMTSFIEHFKAQGKNLFVFTGREYLINLYDRKKAQQEAFFLTASLVRALGIKLILTGCSSPKLQEKLFAVWGFVGQGWFIQAMQRRLIKGKTFMSIFDPRFSCNDARCCGFVDINDLKNGKYDSARAVHNLRRINDSLRETPVYSQAYLEEFHGDLSQKEAL